MLLRRYTQSEMMTEHLLLTVKGRHLAAECTVMSVENVGLGALTLRLVLSPRHKALLMLWLACFKKSSECFTRRGRCGSILAIATVRLHLGQWAILCLKACPPT